MHITNAIFRVDGGWGEPQDCNEFDPNAALSFYDSDNISCDGCMNFGERVTAQGDSESLGGLGINAHSGDLCFAVEFSNSIDYNTGGASFWADGNSAFDPRFTNVRGNVNLNLDGSATITNATGGICNSWSGDVVTTDSDLMSGNCSSQGAGANIN
ncbi:MAG: hypothetical protein GY811_30270 [Myxococcales bacterium]|nr:hypothetical protein [Myxococcales bacterium]